MPQTQSRPAGIALARHISIGVQIVLLTTTCAIANDFSSTGPRDMSRTLLEDALPFTSSVSCPVRSGTEVTEVSDSESIFGTEPAAVVSTLSWFCFFETYLLEYELLVMITSF